MWGSVLEWWICTQAVNRVNCSQRNRREAHFRSYLFQPCYWADDLLFVYGVHRVHLYLHIKHPKNSPLLSVFISWNSHKDTAVLIILASSLGDKLSHCCSTVGLQHKILTYVEYRAVSGVFQNIDPPPPLHPASVSSHRTKGEDARHWIGLLQYNLTTAYNILGCCYFTNTVELKPSKINKGYTYGIKTLKQLFYIGRNLQE